MGYFILESTLFVLGLFVWGVVILTLAAIMLLVQSVRTGAVGGFLRGIGTLLR